MIALVMAARKRPRIDHIDLGSVVKRTNAETDIALKELALTCQYPDASQLCKALKQDAPLDLWQLQLAPDEWLDTFWLKFRMAKAQLKTQERKRA